MRWRNVEIPLPNARDPAPFIAGADKLPRVRGAYHPYDIFSHSARPLATEKLRNRVLSICNGGCAVASKSRGGLTACD